MSLTLQRLVIPGLRSGGPEIAGLLYRPDRAARNLSVVISHGITGSKESVDLLASYIAGRGYAAVTFDFRGHKLGATGGNMVRAADALNDLEAVTTFTRRELGMSQVVLAGHSMGALVSILTAAAQPDFSGCIAIATGMRPTHGFARPVGQAMLSQRSDYVDGTPIPELLAEFQEMAANIPAGALTTVPSLFIAARADALVQPAHVKAMGQHLSPTAQYVEVDGSHLEAPMRARGAVAAFMDHVAG